jgi:hypothetical protein
VKLRKSSTTERVAKRSSSQGASEDSTPKNDSVASALPTSKLTPSPTVAKAATVPPKSGGLGLVDYGSSDDD